MANLKIGNEPLSDKEIKQLVRAFKRAVKEIKRILGEIDPASETLTQAFLESRLAEIYEIMQGLGAEAVAWSNTNVPLYAQLGAAETLVSLGVVKDIQEAKKYTALSTLNKDLLARRLNLVQTDILAGLNDAYRHIQEAVRNASTKVLVDQYATGFVSYNEAKKNLAKEIKRELDKVKEPYVLSGKRKWSVPDYADMLARTHMMNTHHEHTVDRGVQLGCELAIISTHNKTIDACKYHQGRIVRLTKNGPSEYPYWEDLKESGQIFHPRCRHRLLIINELDDLTADEYKFAKKQEILGDRALDVKTKSGKTATNPNTLKSKVDTKLPTIKDDRIPSKSADDELLEILKRNGINLD